MPGTTGNGLTPAVGAPQRPIGVMAVLAGADMSFGSTESGAFLGVHQTTHTVTQGTGAYK